MAERYLAAIRQVQPEGPYQLAGWSFGGTLALEMAQQLHQGAESVALLAIIDTRVIFNPLREGMARIRSVPNQHVASSLALYL